MARLLDLTVFALDNVVVFSVCDFLLLLGKLVIVLITGIVSYLCFARYIPEIQVYILQIYVDNYNCTFRLKRAYFRTKSMLAISL